MNIHVCVDMYTLVYGVCKIVQVLKELENESVFEVGGSIHM